MTVHGAARRGQSALYLHCSRISRGNLGRPLRGRAEGDGGGGGVWGDLEPQRLDSFAGGREDRQ